MCLFVNSSLETSIKSRFWEELKTNLTLSEAFLESLWTYFVAVADVSSDLGLINSGMEKLLQFVHINVFLTADVN